MACGPVVSDVMQEQALQGQMQPGTWTSPNQVCLPTLQGAPTTSLLLAEGVPQGLALGWATYTSRPPGIELTR